MDDAKYLKRPDPPKDVSFITSVTSRWGELRHAALKGEDISLDVLKIDRELNDGRSELKAGNLRAGLDWDLDLRVAEDLHAQNLRWLNTINANNAVVTNYWKETAKRQQEVSTTMMISGVNLIIAGHGTAAIAALNALVSERGKEFQGALVWTIFGACAGLALVAGGKILAIEWLSSMSTAINRKLAFPTPLRLRVISKYVVKFSAKPSKAIPWLIYGSIGWFVFYVAVALLLIVN